MKTEKIITLLLLSVIISFSSVAQEETLMTQLVGKTWCKADVTNQDNLKTEIMYDSDGMFLLCEKSENEKQTLPKWLLSEFYFSENIDTIFNDKSVKSNSQGSYMVMKMKQTIGHVPFVVYKVVSLSDAKLELKQVYTQETETETYITHAELEKNRIEKTTLDKLTGRQWRFTQKPNKWMSKWQRWYFMDGLWAIVNFSYNDATKEWDTDISTRVFYLADWIDRNFSRGEIKKHHENGKYINFYKEHKVPTLVSSRAVSEKGPIGGLKRKRSNLHTLSPEIQSFSYKILYLSNNMLSYEVIPVEYYPHGYDDILHRKIKEERYILRCD